MIVGTTDAAKILKISTGRLRVLLIEGRVEGAYKSGKMWLMPLFNGKPIIQRRKRGPAPRWRNPRIPAKPMVHVNTHKIKENQKQKLQQPVITVKKRKVEPVRSWGFPEWRNWRGGVGFRPAKLFKTRCDPSLISLQTLDAATVATLGNSESAVRKSQNVNLYGHEVEILGGCRVVYRPNASRCGAKVWIETLNEVKVICWD